MVPKTPLEAALDTILGREELGMSRQEAADLLYNHFRQQGQRSRREVKQITACANEVSEGNYNETLYALCNDGSMWYIDYSRANPKWHRVEEIPQDD